MLLLVSFLSGCQLFQRRQNQPIVVGQQTGSTIEGQPQTPLPAGKVLGVGVFFGPGALRSYAHVGVLKSLQQGGIPIVAVGGHEWGAVVAAFYAYSKSANDVEWQMLKLRKDQIPSVGFLNKKITPKEGSAFTQYLKFVFADKNLESTKIPFTCFTTDSVRTYPVNQGKAYEGIAKCASLPPLYKPYEDKWVASPNVEGDWMDQLKAAGAEFYIYIDLLSSDAPLFSKFTYNSQDTLTALWTGIKSFSNIAQRQATMVIQTGATNDLLDFEARRELIKKGEQAGQNALPALKLAIGLSQ